MKDKIKYTKLKILDTPEKVINFKPMSTILVSVIISVLITLAKTYIGSLWLIGPILFVIAVFVFLALKDHKVAAFYEDFFVIYDEKDEKRGKIIKYEEVKEWKSLANSNQPQRGLVVELEGEDIIYIKILQMGAITKQFRKKVPSKETSQIQLSKIQSSPVSLDFMKKKK